MEEKQTVKLVFAALGTLFALAVPALAGRAPPVPFAVAENAWQPLYETVDPGLQVELERSLGRKALWRSLIEAKKMAVGVVDLSDPAAPRFARVNDRAMMYAASLPKIAILLAACVSFEDGSLVETPEIHADLVAMIRNSSNSAATRMIDRMGFDKIAAVLLDPQYGFYDPEQGGGLWVGKRYAKAGGRHPDPIQGLSHAATVFQVCRFYYLLANGKIISPERSRQMLDILADPAIHHKFVCMIEERAPDARMFRKSGTWRNWHCDSVMVWGRVWRHYILVALVEHAQGEQILRDLVPVVESLLEPEEDG
jgi:beta-lactamase class A